MADRSNSKWGRRRPYMLLGALVCAGGLILLGFTAPVAAIFTNSNEDPVSYR